MLPVDNSSSRYPKSVAATAKGKQPSQLNADVHSKLNAILAKPAAAPKGLGMRKAEVLAGNEKTEVKSGEADAKYNTVIGELHDKLGLARKRLQHQLEVLTSKEVHNVGGPAVESQAIIEIKVALGKLELISSESKTEINNIEADRLLAEAIALADRLEFEEAEAKRKAEAMDRGFAEHLALKDQFAVEEASVKAKIKEQEEADLALAERLHAEHVAVAKPAAAAPVLPVRIVEKGEDDDFEAIALPKDKAKEEEDELGIIKGDKGTVEYGLVASIYSWFTAGRDLKKHQEKK